MDNKITVAVITYNCEKYIRKLMDSINISNFRGFELLFIDNASSDGTISLVERCDIDKRVIKLAENKGHSYAANLAMRECKTRYLLLLDHDTIVDEDLFGALYSEAEKEKESEYAVFAPVIIDKSRNETYYGGAWNFIGKTYTIRDKKDTSETYMIGSTAPLLDLEKIPSEIAFDEDFFIYWNDADFFYRIRGCGKKIKLVKNAVVTHLGGTEDYSHRGGAAYSFIRAFYVLRNHRLFILKNYNVSTIVLFLPCFILYEIYNMVFCVKKKICIKGYLKSIIGTLRLLPGISRKRSAFQGIREVGDRELVGWYPLDYNPGVISGEADRFFINILSNILKIYFTIISNIFWKK